MNNKAFRQQFPFFKHTPQWTYLDSAATTLKPQVLIDATSNFYTSAGSVHRSQYDLIQTQAYEHARDLIMQRFNVAAREAIVWTSGTTQSLNTVAYGLEHKIQEGDEILISVAEHHANFLPWQQLAWRKQAKFTVLPLDANFQVDLTALKAALSEKTKVVALQLYSNVTGARQPVEQIIPLIRQHSQALIVLDIAQAVCCEQVDVQALDADFYAFSAHKMYGPNGVGVLMGKVSSMALLQPLMFGGKMLQHVTESTLTLADLPYRLEAGTPNIAGIIGFEAVLDWLNQWDMAALNAKCYQLSDLIQTRLADYPQIQVLGMGQRSTISFSVENLHPSDVASVLTQQHIAIRNGEHCAKPYLQALLLLGTLRVSLAHYNLEEDIDAFFKGLDVALKLFAD